MDFDDESEASRLRAFVPKFGEPSVRDTHADTLLLQSAGSMLHFYNSYKHTPNKLKHNLLQTLLPSHLLIFLLHLFYVFFSRFGRRMASPSDKLPSLLGELPSEGNLVAVISNTQQVTRQEFS
jgi:hypothetical protein